jgi:CBS domain-containing protein
VRRTAKVGLDLQRLRRRPVSSVMRGDVVTLAPDETLDVGQDIMRLGRVRHLPVLDEDGRLVGIVSKRDLLESSLSRALEFDPASRRAFLGSVQVREVMSEEVVSVGPETSLEDAAQLLVLRQIGCLPVVGDDGTMLGLVTETDLLGAAFLVEEKTEEDS